MKKIIITLLSCFVFASANADVTIKVRNIENMSNSISAVVETDMGKFPIYEDGALIEGVEIKMQDSNSQFVIHHVRKNVDGNGTNDSIAILNPPSLGSMKNNLSDMLQNFDLVYPVEIELQFNDGFMGVITFIGGHVDLGADTFQKNAGIVELMARTSSVKDPENGGPLSMSELEENS